MDFDHFLLSNLRSTDTGVEGAVVWVSAGADQQHGPRLMVVLGDKIAKEGLKDAVAVRITDPPEVLGELPGRIEERVVKFVAENRDALLRHWHGEIDTKEMLDSLKSVSPKTRGQR